MSDNEAHAHYAGVIVKYLKGQDVEIYFGNQNTTINYSDKSVAQNELIHGKVVDFAGDCLIIDCTVNGITVPVFINGWSILAIMPTSTSLSMKDICYDEMEMLRKRRGI